MNAPVPAAAPVCIARVLLVEDNPVNLLVARTLLTELGADVGVAHNGIEALELLHAEPWHLVLMDCQMPEMDGYEATRRWRAHEQARGAATRLPIVAVTANALPADRARSFDAGMDDHLAKPYRTADLKDLLARFCPPAG